MMKHNQRHDADVRRFKHTTSRKPNPANGTPSCKGGIKLPWQFSVFITASIYLIAGWMIWNWPCEDSLLLGLCGITKLVLLVFEGLLFLLFLILVTIQWRMILKRVEPDKTKDQSNTRISGIALVFTLIPILFVIFLSLAE